MRWKRPTTPERIQTSGLGGDPGESKVSPNCVTAQTVPTRLVRFDLTHCSLICNLYSRCSRAIGTRVCFAISPSILCMQLRELAASEAPEISRGDSPVFAVAAVVAFVSLAVVPAEAGGPSVTATEARSSRFFSAKRETHCFSMPSPKRVSEVR